MESQINQTNSSVVAKKPLDLVFTIDCTGSMGSYIHAAKESIQSIIQKIITQEKTDVRFGLVAYRDHPPQDSTYVSKSYDFTDSMPQMQTNLNELSAAGGGDGPEALTAALHATSLLPWRKNAAKVIVLIADAPPHGIGEAGDGFPNGDPDGHDPLQIARELARREIVIYSVGCEPALSGYQNARAFMVALAEITQGQAINLATSSLLGDVILGGSLEEIGLQTLSAQYEAEMASLASDFRSRGRDLEEESTVNEIAGELQSRMKMRGEQACSLKTDGQMADSRSCLFNAPTINSLDEARKLLAENSAPVSHVDLGYASIPMMKRAMPKSVFRAELACDAPPLLSHGAPMGMFGGSRSLASAAPPPMTKEMLAAPEASARSASSCDVVVEEVSLSQCSKILKRAQMAGKLG